VLQTLIREDRILVYIDDILNLSSLMDENLQTLRDVLFHLKQYEFELNYEKGLFLRKIVEFLGYIMSRGSIILSKHHVEAIYAFKQLTNVVEVLSLCISS